MQRSELPHEPLCEAAVLGVSLLNQDLRELVMTDLRAEDFFENKNREVFQAIRAMNFHAQTIDIVTLTDYMGENGTLKFVGGAAYISTLLDHAMEYRPSVEAYIAAIRKAAKGRRIINRLLQLLETACDTDNDPDEVIASLKNEVWDA